jgi:hypothetical protein
MAETRKIAAILAADAVGYSRRLVAPVVWPAPSSYRPWRCSHHKQRRLKGFASVVNQCHVVTPNCEGAWQASFQSRHLRTAKTAGTHYLISPMRKCSAARSMTLRSQSCDGSPSFRSSQSDRTSVFAAT